MAYTVLARRYRSTAFGEVVGQEPIAETLRNAIRTGRVAHAYLFCGTRGVGKTSMARILARALNAPATVEDCPEPADAGEYPDPEVQERMGKAIMSGEDLNVIEIDAASNRGVQEARDLIANAGLAPSSGARHKVYIVDEVHMLTPASFNTLLKTMEEPPEHVKFILCTTEPEKVPPTIQSRCQRFDFRNIAASRIADHLSEVLESEGVKARDELVHRVARLGNGSMRDALSLLDRLIATGEEELTGELLDRMLGLPPQEAVSQLIDALAAGNASAALKAASELLDQGVAQEQLLGALVDRLRQLMLIASCGADSDLVELDGEAREQAAEQAGQFDPAGLVHMIAVCESISKAGRGSANPRALLDAGIIRLALSEKMADVTAVLSASGSGQKKN